MKELELYNAGKNLIVVSDHIIESCRTQNYEDAIVGMKQLIFTFGNWAETLLPLVAQDGAGEVFPSQDSVMQTLNQLLEAQKIRDYCLLADYLELSAKPLFFAVQDGIRVVFPEVTIATLEENYQKNKDGLSSESQKLDSVECYLLEDTSSGYLTVALEDEQGSYYLHSNVNPVVEGEQIASQYFEPKISEYFVIGAGLGYHVRAMLAYGEYIKVRVYETDARMLKSMLSIFDYSSYIANGQLSVILDEHLNQLAEQLQKNDSAKIMIHAPSIRNIHSAELRKKIQIYYNQESGIRKNIKLLDANFYQNLKYCKGIADSYAKHAFEGKQVIIVSAGPSFSKNVELLKQRSNHTVVLAVTTVYRKLISLGIVPDYVIHSDAQAKTYFHLQGVNQSVPMFVLSTAYEGCARQYAGDCYMVLQKDYDNAENYAKEHGAHLFETGGSVATIALSLALESGAKQVLLIGQDLAYTDGLAHAKGVSKQAIGEEQELVKVPAYHGGMIDTSLILSGFIGWFSDYAKKMDAKQEVIVNCTEGGAKIKGIRQLPLCEVLEQA